MAYWNTLGNQSRPIINSIGNGINTSIPALDIEESQSPDLKNVDSYNFPALSPRPEYDNVGSSFSGFVSLLIQYKNNKILKILGNKIYSLEGTTWTERATLPVTPTKSLDYVNFMDKIYIAVDTSGLVELDPSDWSITTVTNAPDADGITAHANRLYAIYDKKLHYSGLRDVDNWNVVDESGSIQVDTSFGEDLVAVTVFNNHVVVLSDNGLYELYGTGPSNYQLMTITREIGCISQKSVIELNNTLFWLGSDGVYAYDGGNLPEKISWGIETYIQRLNKDYDYIVQGGRDGRRYYLSLPFDNETTAINTLVYDTEIGAWYYQQIGDVKAYIELQNEMYISTPTQLKKLDKDVENFTGDWYWVSKQFNDTSTAKRVTWKRVYLIVDLPVGSTLSVHLSVDEGDWELLYTLTGSDSMQRKKILVPISMAYNVDWVAIKLSGSGYCKIHEIQRYMMIKSW